jgi:aminoglycoside phosphotransferase (APT) family kinase protein
VLKLFRSDIPASWADHEFRIATGVHQAGVPCPEPAAMVCERGRAGIVFERVAGVSMLEALLHRPWTIPRQARSFARLHADIHSRTAPGVPAAKSQLRATIQVLDALDTVTRDRLLRTLESLPDGTALCHGDYHPGNVMLTSVGPVAIDWPNAALGDPMADVAKTLLLIRLAGPLPPTVRARMLLAARAIFASMYLRSYLALRPGGRERIAAWMPPIAAARLEDGIPHERARLTRMLNAA